MSEATSIFWQRTLLVGTAKLSLPFINEPNEADDMVETEPPNLVPSALTALPADGIMVDPSLFAFI
jgi:hypothetical protein